MLPSGVKAQLDCAREDLQRATEAFNDLEEHKVFGQWLAKRCVDFEAHKAKSLRCMADLEQEGRAEVVIAFFGETNAGKSTLIETLRLFFKEESKLQQQASFKKVRSHFKTLSPREQEQSLGLADGAIIGDGRTDFTKDFTPYHFTLRGGGGNKPLSLY